MKRVSSSPLSDAVRKAASDWIARLDAGLSAAEQAEFQAWCDASPLHAEAVARYERLWRNLDRPRALGASAELNSDLTRLRQRDRRRRARWAATASLSLLVSWAAWSTFCPPAFTTSAPGTAPLAIIVPDRRELPDGTVVEYPAGTDLRVDFSSPGFRRVTLLRGEAHFAVAKDPSRPFIVEATGVSVQAVGTAFSVQLGSSAVEVLVTEGQVTVDPATSREPQPREAAEPNPALLDAGQKISVAVGPAAARAASPPENLSPAEIAQRLVWRNPRMEFSNAPLDDVVAAINRYAAAHGGARFVIQDPPLGAKRLSGIFRVDEPGTFIAILENGFGIEAMRQGAKTIVLRGGD